MDDQARTRLSAIVRGTVQGVGFRYYTRKRASRLGLTGVVSNQVDGSVLVVAEGVEAAARSLSSWLSSGDTPGRVDSVDESYGEPTGEFTDFRTE